MEVIIRKFLPKKDVIISAGAAQLADWSVATRRAGMQPAIIYRYLDLSPTNSPMSKRLQRCKTALTDLRTQLFSFFIFQHYLIICSLDLFVLTKDYERKSAVHHPSVCLFDVFLD